MPAGILDKNPRGFDPSNLDDTGDVENDDDPTRPTSRTHVSSLEGSVRLAGHNDYDPTTGKPDCLILSGSSRLEVEVDSNDTAEVLVSKGIDTLGTLCYRCTIPQLVSPTDGDNLVGKGIDTLGTLCYRCTIPPPVLVKDGDNSTVQHKACEEEPGADDQGHDLTKLACLWAQQELCGRRPVKYDPFEWACKGRNVDSFLLYARLKRLPKVPTVAEAVAQQRQVHDDEARDAEMRRSNEARPQGPPPPTYNSMHVSMFDDEDGGEWQHEPDDWWHLEPNEHEMHEEEA